MEKKVIPEKLGASVGGNNVATFTGTSNTSKLKFVLNNTAISTSETWVNNLMT